MVSLLLVLPVVLNLDQIQIQSGERFRKSCNAKAQKSTRKSSIGLALALQLCLSTVFALVTTARVSSDSPNFNDVHLLPGDGRGQCSYVP